MPVNDHEKAGREAVRYSASGLACHQQVNLAPMILVVREALVTSAPSSSSSGMLTGSTESPMAQVIEFRRPLGQSADNR